MHTAALTPAQPAVVLPLIDTMRTEVVAGQYRDVTAAGRPTADLDRALLIARYKTATYASVVAATATRTRAITRHEHVLTRPYIILDNAALHRHLRHDSISEITGRAVAVTHGRAGSTVHLADGRRITTGLVVDATGSRRALTAPRAPRQRAVHTALEVITDAPSARALLPHGEGTFMDWRSVPGIPPGRPTFLYAMRLGGDRVVLDETCLARRSASPPSESA